MRHFIIIPVYNDWKSLKKLLFKLSMVFKSKKDVKNSIIIINDNSSEKINFNLKKFNFFKNSKIITLNNNIGSQKAIAVALNYLCKQNGDFFITIMDGDGEDEPKQVPKMLDLAKQNQNFVITSNRKKRKESLTIIFLYKLHLIITFLFTFKWISFGNFTSFHKRNLHKLLSNNKSWYAHSSSVIKNCKTISLYAKREKRYFGKSKLNLLALIEHSFRVNSAFILNIFFSFFVYFVIINFFFYNSKFILNIIIFSYFFGVIVIYLKHWIKNLSKINKYVKNIKSF
tara:strand:- start:536 stop:1390 length:855 start_codon:yes stop_codon:yes gene_type:complete